MGRLTKYTLVVKGSDMDLLAAALGKLPFEAVAKLYTDLQQQCAVQEARAQHEDTKDKVINEAAGKVVKNKQDKAGKDNGVRTARR